jgi:hypothetical protein
MADIATCHQTYRQRLVIILRLMRNLREFAVCATALYLLPNSPNRDSTVLLKGQQQWT